MFHKIFLLKKIILKTVFVDRSVSHASTSIVQSYRPRTSANHRTPGKEHRNRDNKWPISSKKSRQRTTRLTLGRINRQRMVTWHILFLRSSAFFPYINFFIEKRGFFLFLCRTSHAFSCVAYGHMLLCSSNLLWSKIYGVCVWRETRRHCGLMFEYPVEFIVLLGSRQSSSYGLRVGTANPGFSDSQTRHVRKPT